MTDALLSLHILAAILTIGPVTVAASMFAPAVRGVLADPGSGTGQLTVLHRICRVYGAVAIVVPVVGIVLAARKDLLGQAWLSIAMVLTAVAAPVLLGVILPAQRRVLDELTPGGSRHADSSRRPAGPGPAAAVRVQDLGRQVTARLAVSSGAFNLLWVSVVVLMVVRPGTSTGD